MHHKQLVPLLALILALIVGFGLRVYLLPQAPPALHFDEAANGLLVRQMAYDGYRPLFILPYGGKEPIWFYAAALLTWLTGMDVLGLRLTSIFFGMLSMAAGGWAVGQVCYDHPKRRWIVALALAIFAVGFWHVLLSRIAFRALTQPLMQALAIGALLRALRLSRIGSTPGNDRRFAINQFMRFFVAGLAIGAAAYTYVAVRLFPIPVGLTLLGLLIFDRARIRRLGQLAAYGAGAVIAFAPLGWFFLNNPDRFFIRYGQVAVDSAAEMLRGWQLALGMFFWRGDAILRLNFPLKPIFDPINGAFFVLGLLIVLRDLIRQRDPLQRSRNLLLLLWLPAMLAPVALSVGDYAPSNLRGLGMLPLILVYPALALVEIGGWIAQLGAENRGAWAEGRRHRLFDGLMAGAFSLILIGGGLDSTLTLRRWAESPDLFINNDGPTQSMGQYLADVDSGALDVYAATFHYQHPTLIYFLPRDYRFGSIYQGDALVIGPGNETLMVYERFAPLPEEWRGWLAPYLVDAPEGIDGGTDFWAYRLPGDLALPVDAVPPVILGGSLRLTGLRFQGAISGEDAEVDLAFDVIAPAPAGDLMLVAEACDTGGWCWLRTTGVGELLRGQNQAVRSAQWVPGERLLLRMRVPLPVGMPTNEVYELRLSLYDLESGETLAAQLEGEQTAGRYAYLPDLRVSPNTAADARDLPMGQRADLNLLPGLVLLGYDLPVGQYRPGEAPLLALHLRTEGRINGHGLLIRLADGTLLQRFDLPEMQAGEILSLRVRERLPADLAAGSYRLSVQAEGGEAFELAVIEVQGLARRFNLPDGMAALETPVEFGMGLIDLLAIDAPSEARPDEALPVTLGWQARVAPTDDYVVFLHLIDADGNIVAQVDRPPLVDGEAYGTSLWLAGEVVIDAMDLALPLDLPAGEYRLRLGFYLPDTGERLALESSSDNAYIPGLIIRVR